MQNALIKKKKTDNNDHTFNFALSLCLDPLSEDCCIIEEVQSGWGEKCISVTAAKLSLYKFCQRDNGPGSCQFTLWRILYFGGLVD